MIDFFDVVRLNLDVLDDPVPLLNPNQRAQLTEALAARLLDAHIGPGVLLRIMGSKLQIDCRIVRN